MLNLNAEFCHIVAPHGEVALRWLSKCEDYSVSSEQLRHSGEFPRVDLMFAGESVRISQLHELLAKSKADAEVRARLGHENTTLKAQNAIL